MPVTADDVDEAVQLTISLLRDAPADAWENNAGALTWTCWETVEHLADDLFSYAGQLGAPTTAGFVPFIVEPRREGGPGNAVHAERESGPDGLLQVLKSTGALLTAMVRVTPPEVRSYHGFGVSDAEGFAAMGLVEILVHAQDLADGLGLKWDPPAELAAKVLTRLFPDVPSDTDPWPTLLWATGRGDLPGHDRRTKWRWYSEVR